MLFSTNNRTSSILYREPRLVNKDEKGAKYEKQNEHRPSVKPELVEICVPKQKETPGELVQGGGINESSAYSHENSIFYMLLA